MGKKAKRPRRPVPRVPKGFRDLGPGDLAERRRMIERVSAVYERYGFTRLTFSPAGMTSCFVEVLPPGRLESDTNLQGQGGIRFCP